MINYNKLYSGLFSIFLIYTIMTVFELIFFAFVVCPVITDSIHQLMDSYSDKTTVPVIFNTNPVDIIVILNQREYQLINSFNFNSYLVVIILVLLLASLLFYLYMKIGVIEYNEHTEVSPNVSLSSIISRPRTRSISRTSESSELVIDSAARRTTSQNSNNTDVTTRSIKFIYLKHAFRCAVSTVACLIIYQIFFYNYGLGFKYVGSSNELIVLFIETVSN
jgi:hypothetical protein